MPLSLAVEHLHRSYGRLTAVDDLSLRVPAGGSHAVIGPNGAGKTTLLNLIAGLLRPDHGAIRLGDRDVTRLGVVGRARIGLGRTHQTPAVLPSLSAVDNLIAAGWRSTAEPLASLSRKRFNRSCVLPAMDLLDRFGLADDHDVVAGHLSHGKRRQLEIAMALIGQPQVLLLDEPAAGLTPSDVEHLAAVLTSLPAMVTVLLVDHNLDLVYACAAAVTVMASGREIATGPTCDIQSSRLTRDAYATAV